MYWGVCPDCRAQAPADLPAHPTPRGSR
jgi:hypothetical protein